LVLVALQAEVLLMDKMEATLFLVLLPQLAVAQAQTMFLLAMNQEAMAVLVVEQETTLVERVLEIHLLHLHLREITAAWGMVHLLVAVVAQVL
jgi:hypothetical protein